MPGSSIHYDDSHELLLLLLQAWTERFGRTALLGSATHCLSKESILTFYADDASDKPSSYEKK